MKKKILCLAMAAVMAVGHTYNSICRDPAGRF